MRGVFMVLFALYGLIVKAQSPINVSLSGTIFPLSINVGESSLLSLNFCNLSNASQVIPAGYLEVTITLDNNFSYIAQPSGVAASLFAWSYTGDGWKGINTNSINQPGCNSIQLNITGFSAKPSGLVSYEAKILNPYSDSNPSDNAGSTVLPVNPPPCPGDTDIQLGFGECGIVLPSLGFQFSDIPVDDIVSHANTNPNLINSTIYCASGQTRYSRIFYNAGPTDMIISHASIGVFKSSDSPLVTVNFYKTNGILLGSHTAALPDLDRALYNLEIPSGKDIIIPSQTSYVMEVVANAPYLSVFKIGRNNAGHHTGYTEAAITAPDCTAGFFNEEIHAGNPGITPNSIVFGVIGTPKDYRFINTSNSRYEGDFFPIGNHLMNFSVTNAYGISRQCQFNVIIREFQDPTGALACNDLVQVALDDDCNTVVTPDMMLEGNQYGCFDNFKVQITALNGINLGNTVSAAQMGQTLKVQVISSTGNSCWGEIAVQDKLPPALLCEDLYVTCTTDLKPGSDISPRVPVVAPIANGSISDGKPSSRSFVIPVAHLKNAVITDLDVYLDVNHSRVGDLAANITSPDGITVPLFMGSDCSGTNMMLTLDDAAAGGHDDFQNTCEAASPAVTGRFRPFNKISVFNGKPLEGNWVVTVFDLKQGEGGYVNNIHLIFSQSGGKVRFPVKGNATGSHVADNTWMVQNGDNCGNAIMTYSDEVVQEDCASVYSKIIRRCWNGHDERSNVSAECCQLIYVYRNSLATLQFPPDFDGLNDNPEALSCELYGSTIPPTSVTGLPYGDLCDNVQIFDPVDVKIDICSNSYKLLRTHKVLEWCTGQVISHNQIIKVMDHDAPELNCPENITISTDYYNCLATYTVPLPELGFECSEKVTFDLSYNYTDDENDGFATLNADQVTHVVSGLVLGDNRIRWQAEDLCGNTSECRFTVSVEDQVLPNPVCDQVTVASVSGNGKATMAAVTLDDGSNDNCGVFSYEARKMTDACGQSTSVYAPFIDFCCEEVNTTIMVELKVTDIHKNSNTCMVEVRVQDKLPPYITVCPPDVTLSCKVDYTDLEITGEPVYVDNCGVDSVYLADKVTINQCGVGEIIRKWTVRDRQGYTNSCTQVITLTDFDPFYVNVSDPLDPNDDIIWPAHYETSQCYANLDPESLPNGFNKPTFNDDPCSLVAISHKDQVFSFVDGACEKILRTWQVIDWCTYREDEYGHKHGLYEYVQIIKLVNIVPPVFDGTCADYSIGIFGECEGEVTYTMSAEDDCPDDDSNLKWKYTLFSEFGTIPLATANSEIFSEVLEIGKYRVLWSVEDQCGNKTSCTQWLNINDGKKPSPYCYSSLTTAVMNSNGTVAIWARDYDKGAIDNCTDAENLIFTFNGAFPVADLINKEHYFKNNGEVATQLEYQLGIAQIWIPEKNTSGILFQCSDIPDGKSHEVSIEVWVTDQAENSDYCTIRLVLQDNAGVCPDSDGNLTVSGNVMHGNKMMKGVQVKLSNGQTDIDRIIETDAAGKYTFTSLKHGENYTIKASDNRNILNGVSTLDLVLIQRHILGIQLLDDPKKIIAADVDNNQKITAADLLSLRKTILGMSNQFPNGQQSWRFVATDHTFTNPQQPFPFKEAYVYNPLNQNMTGQRLSAVKIGDVNNSASTIDNNPVTENRNNKSLKLRIPELNAVKGDLVTLPVYASDMNDVLGFQGTLEFDANFLELVDIEAGALKVSDANFGLQLVQKGFITTSYHQEQGMSFEAGETMFNLVFRAVRDVEQTTPLRISGAITPAVAYNTAHQAMELHLDRRTNDTEPGFEVFQNTPNPFTAFTNIPFLITQSGVVKVQVTDVMGRVIFSSEDTYQKGSHTISFQNTTSGISSVLLCSVSFGNEVITRKMIVIPD